MGQGTSQNSWSPGNEGVRVTVIRAESHDPVTRPIDLTNKHPNIAYSFGKVSKMSYTRGSALMKVWGRQILSRLKVILQMNRWCAALQD